MGCANYLGITLPNAHCKKILQTNMKYYINYSNNHHNIDNKGMSSVLNYPYISILKKAYVDHFQEKLLRSISETYSNFIAMWAMLLRQYTI